MAICDKCGKEENDELANFCQACGEKLSTYSSGEDATVEKNNQWQMICGEKGHKIQSNNAAKYCKMCGNKLLKK